jgi:M6 family metalloprotease-like protein
MPGSVTADISAGADSNFLSTLGVEIINASYTDAIDGEFAALEAGVGALSVLSEPSSLTVVNDFISDTGWVHPGEGYVFRVSVINYATDPFSDVTVSVPSVDGMTITQARALGAGATADVLGGTVTWTLPTVAAGSIESPTRYELIVEAQTRSTGQDPQLVWKNLSTTATMTYGAETFTSTSLGPHVIPPDGSMDSARYGVRPFPVVPVDYSDRKHQAENTGDRINSAINSPDVPGSTRNLYEEMSFGQLRPVGTVPSTGIASADWESGFTSERYQDGWHFTEPEPSGACYGTTQGAFTGTSPLIPERIHDGWYQLPGDTGYYGGDDTSYVGFGGAVAGVANPNIDAACGPTGKSVYDAAHIADPEIDYNDYDTDKDGVVDFFMLLFVGCGGHGASQLGPAGCSYQPNAPYDNIWPHSSSLEFYYTDEETGLTGYISDDRLTDLEGNLLFYTDTTYTALTTDETDYPAYVRVGPYNVNPEDSVEKASVISHEYGHSLGLPDYYSIDPDRETYGSWNLMATDHQQHMDVHAKQDMGWIIPRDLSAGETLVTDWTETRVDTHRIDWQTPDGEPYTLTGDNIHNSQAYRVPLPPLQIIDPAVVERDASLDHVFWSGSGNNFGCSPTGGHNMDVWLPELKDVAEGTPITATFKSFWDIEWDWDYGFVLLSNDGGQSYTSLPSQNGYTTESSNNPNAIGCLTTYNNGITGQSGSYAAGTETIDRNAVLGGYAQDPVFLEDSFDLSSAAGADNAVLRFSYFTDAGFARPGWFIDDLVIKAGDEVIYSSDFEDGREEDRLFQGGCSGHRAVASTCTDGWNYISASEGSTADHSYYLELRDRASFDLDGKGQDDRGDGPTFAAGLYLQYTNEGRGYGNTGLADAPAQTPLDSQPEAGVQDPNLDDAAFTAVELDRVYSDFGDGWTDNYLGENGEDQWVLQYDCLRFEVERMSGDELGPADGPGDLTADVLLKKGDGCAPFNYGHGTQSLGGAAPTAAMSFKPDHPAVGEQVLFDGSLSSDDTTAKSALVYEWDFGDGTTGSGQTVGHTYESAGTFTVTLTVTDKDGQTDTAVLDLTVGGAPGSDGEPLPTTGGGAVAAALLGIAAAASLRQRTRRR